MSSHFFCERKCSCMSMCGCISQLLAWHFTLPSLASYACAHAQINAKLKYRTLTIQWNCNCIRLSLSLLVCHTVDKLQTLLGGRLKFSAHSGNLKRIKNYQQWFQTSFSFIAWELARRTSSAILITKLLNCLRIEKSIKQTKPNERKTHYFPLILLQWKICWWWPFCQDVEWKKTLRMCIQCMQQQHIYEYCRW